MKEHKLILKFLEYRYGIYKDSYPKMNNQEIFELLVETVLSQRTRDENSHLAAQRLFKFAKTPEQMLELPTREMERLIMISGPYRQKAKRIKLLSKMIIEKHGGRIPSTRMELVELPGVGPKTADIVLMYGFGIPSIAIDTHCNRVSKRIGLVEKRASLEEVKKVLESIFPRGRWYLVNVGLVSFGKEICRPVSPLCVKGPENCPFSRFCQAYKTKDFRV